MTIIEILDTFDEIKTTCKLSPEQSRVLEILIKKFNALFANEIQQSFYKAAEESNTPIKEVFQAFYTVLMDKEKGPRAGWLVQSLGIDFVCERLIKASKELK